MLTIYAVLYVLPVALGLLGGYFLSLPVVITFILSAIFFWIWGSRSKTPPVPGLGIVLLWYLGLVAVMSITAIVIRAPVIWYAVSPTLVSLGYAAKKILLR